MNDKALQLVMSSLVLLALLFGCNRSGNRGEGGTVTGIVTMDGEPLPEAVVFFIPNSGGPASQGATDDSGHYQLRYSAEQAGAAVGQHRVRIVTVLSTSDPGDEADGDELETIPPRYNHRSELIADVQPGENRFDFDLTSQ